MIIVFGSLNIDVMMPVSHLPAPGETVLCSTDYFSNAGGKGGNQAVAAVRAGAKVAIVGMVGDDSFGRRSISNLRSQSILTTGIALSERPTGCATIAVDPQGKNIVMSAPGANLDANAEQLPDELFTPRNLLLTQLEVRPEEAFKVIDRAHAGNCVTILNCAPAHAVPSETLAHIDYIIMNRLEAQQFAETLGLPGASPEATARGIVALAPNITAIITLEDRGAIAVRGTNLYAINALEVDVVDTSGAGDTFCGIFAACLQNGHDWLVALHYASVGSSLSCLGLGAQDGAPFMEEIIKHLHEIEAPRLVS